MSEATRAEVCAVACADLFRDAGEILVSPMAPMPSLGARLARLTFSPDILLSDGEAFLLAETPGVGGPSPIEGWLPYRLVFDLIGTGRRHVVMGANQIGRYGAQNISCLGPHDRPTRQMLGARGAPGNTINHRTSYWVPKHSGRVFVEAVDFASGVGYDRAVGVSARFHDVHRVVTNLAVLDFGGPDHAMRLVSTHPGVSVDDVQQQTGFVLDTSNVVTSRIPTDEELSLLRDVLDPKGTREREVPS